MNLHRRPVPRKAVAESKAGRWCVKKAGAIRPPSERLGRDGPLCDEYRRF